MAITTMPEVHFQSSFFDAEISGHGTTVLWRRHRICPCIDRNTGNADVGCPHCQGEMLLWDAGREIRVLMFGRSRRDQYDVPGLLFQGTCNVTFPTGVIPAHYDRLDLVDARMVVTGELLVRGDIDKLGRSRERLQQKFISVEYCEAIVDDQLIAYQYGQDFTVDGDGVVRWSLGAGPPDGARYSMRYVAVPAFVVWSPMPGREENGQQMPYRAYAQLLAFFRRKAAGEP